MRRALIISFITVLTALAGALFCQPSLPTESLHVIPFGVEKGLRQSMVNRVIQDHRGLIWMVTGDGLHCFDGTEFRVFRVPDDSIFKNSDNIMRGLVESARGRLVVTTSNSVLEFNTSTGHFTLMYSKKGSYPILLDQLTDHRPLVWLNDLKLVRPGKNGVEQMKLHYKDRQQPPSGFFPKQSLTDTSGIMYLTGNDGFVIVEIANPLADSSFNATWVPVEQCQSLGLNKKGELLVLAGGILQRYSGKLLTGLFSDERLKRVTSMFIDSKDNIWFTNIARHEHFHLSHGVLKIIDLYCQDGRHIDPVRNSIRSVFEDDHQNLWFGTGSDGVLLCTPGKISLYKEDIGFTRCITMFGGKIWAGTYREGLWKLSPDLSSRQPGHNGKGPDTAYYVDLLTDNHQKLWCASRYGVEVMDLSGNTVFTRKFRSNGAKLALISEDTMLLFTDSELFRFKTGNQPALIESVPGIQVSSFLQLEEMWWIGNQFGLYRSSKADYSNKFRMFDRKHQLLVHPVYGLIHLKGTVWAATERGIVLFDDQGRQLAAPGFLKEVKDEVVYSLVADRQGRVWFTGNNGMGCIDLQHRRINFFRSPAELQSPEFNANASYQSPDGRIYFGGIRGINGFDPAWFGQGKSVQQVGLVSLSVADTAWTEGIPGNGISLTLHRDAPNISGKVFCSDYREAGSLLFSFFLEGYQRTWSKPSASAEFDFRDLPPGEYRLLVKCTDTWQIESEPVLLLTLRLDPPFWKTLWFLVLLLLFIAATTAFIVRKVNSVRYRKKISQLEQQNAIEKERLRISKDMHDDLGASLTRISILSEMAKRQQDDHEKSQQIIEQISSIAGGVVDDMGEIIWAMNPRNDTLDSLAAYLREHASSYLEAAGIDGIFRFPAEIPAVRITSELRRNIFLTVKEALHNVVKHAGARNVHIRLEINQKNLVLQIMDDGRGFDMQQTSGWGNGLINMRKRIEENGGHFEINSAAGKGTVIDLSVSIPDHDKSY